MDFSSVSRAFESLVRRNPPLPDDVVDRCKGILASSLTDSNQLVDTIIYFISTPILRTSFSDEQKEEVTAAGIVTQTGYRWEPLAVGFYVATELLNQQHAVSSATKPSIVDVIDENENTALSTTNVYVDGPRVPSVVTTDAIKQFDLPKLSPTQMLTLCDSLHAGAMEHFEHMEPRVRTLIAKAISSYSKVPETIWPNQTEFIGLLHSRLIKSINEHISSGRDETGNYSRTSDGAFDDTTGWKALETNWLALASLISALQGFYLEKFGITDELLMDCENSAIKHVNRHVRAAAMACLEQMVHACKAAFQSSKSDDAVYRRVQDVLLDSMASPGAILRKTCVAVSSAGLADNWSQVRMAASVLCRVLFLTLKDIGTSLEDIYPPLLPRMCLNRFYLAQGVKIYSHETWKLVFVESGLPMIVENLPAVCRYYVKMCDADNHAVREAACQAIAELSVRLGDNCEYRDKLGGQIDTLLQALVMCFHDESWPVRDEACLACGIICKTFPEECRPELKMLWERWTEQLTDQIWSVRQDAAVALGDALEAYGPEFLDQLRILIRKILPAARDQPAMTREEFKQHVNDAEAHSNSQLYSCGSLAPKLRKGGAGRIGCSSCGIDRPKAPWEATDGCIYLLRELCYKCSPRADGSGTIRDDILLSDAELKSFLQELADVCRVQHFPQSDDLRATLWRVLPEMAHSIGKERFKRFYMDIFMDLLFNSIESRTASQLSVHAAGLCAEELASFVGTAIFRGRLEDDQKEIFDRTMRERQMMPKGPASGGDAFSPFGPVGLLASLYNK
jgi:HEAT repeat